MRRRGQAAMEFIMTYGWAILVVLAAIGALAYFGVLSPSKYLPEKCIFTTGVGCKDFVFLRDGSGALDINFTITNSLGDSMTIIGGQTTVTYNANPRVCLVNGVLSDVTIAADASVPVVCVDVVSSGITAGQNLKASAFLNYTTSQGVYTKSAVGDMSGKVQ